MHIVNVCQPCISFLHWGMQMEMVQWAGCCTFSVLLSLPPSQLKIPCLFLIRANSSNVWWNTLHSLKSWRLVHYFFKYQQKYISTVQSPYLDTWKIFKEHGQGGVGMCLAKLATTIRVLPSSWGCTFQGIGTELYWYYYWHFSLQVLLLSLSAGGVGLNLIGGNHLFLLDPHWNPQLEAQAFDRIYRVGQTKSCHIYK